MRSGVMLWSRVKVLVMGERFGHMWRDWSWMNGFCHRCRIKSGANGLVTDERFGHRWTDCSLWSRLNGLVIVERFDHLWSRVNGLVSDEGFCHGWKIWFGNVRIDFGHGSLVWSWLNDLVIGEQKEPASDMFHEESIQIPLYTYPSYPTLQHTFLNLSYQHPTLPYPTLP